MVDKKQKSPKMTQNQTKLEHVPVLLEPVLQYLDPQPKETLLDLTAGYGGHSGAIRTLTNGWPVTLVDRDEMAISYLKQRFNDEGAEIIHADFLSASKNLAASGKQFDLILADLGVSSPHLNIASRGFSLQQNGPLDMRMDTSQEVTAADLVNHSTEKELIEMLLAYGEEPKAYKIARAIIEHRPFQTTNQLATVVAKQFRGYHKVHPATQTFQALRIVVNDELGQLQQALPYWLHLLKPGGRLGVISFHSLEDRLVKEFFNDHSGDRYDADLKLLTKRPVSADKHELVSNPRSRSAKLRVALKIKTKERG